MAGIILESAMVLVPLACAALYIVVTSSALLVVFLLGAAAATLVVLRLRYHYSSGARSDLAIRAKAPAAETTDRPDRESHEFDEIIRDVHQHCDVDGEVVQRSGALLSDAVTPASTQYNAELFGAALSYDHRCFYVCGQPTWVLAADFDYWRLPAAASAAQGPGGPSPEPSSAACAAWRRALLQYKAMGFSAVRIRFHWGHHSPSKGTYDFAGHRDVDRLLSLCEELGVLVIACLGPFIGDDVQGGGYPFWLIQRDHIRLRHLWRSGLKVWDDRFAAAEGEWYDKIIAKLAGHEIVTQTARGRGCVLMVQLENRLGARGALGLPLALHDETRLLARMARERVVRTPLVTNNLSWPDDFSSPSARLWARLEKRLQAYRIIAQPYRTDISGFTVRDVNSAPLDLDAVAQTTRGDNVPMVALELRRPAAAPRGLFCDQIESALSQGLAVLSLPGFFDLGCRGNLASPQCQLSSASCCAAVASDGTLSADARAARLVLHAARALELQLVASDPVGARPWIARACRPAVRGVSVNKLPQGAVRVRRQWECAAAAVQAPYPARKDGEDADGGAQLGIVAYVDGRGLPAGDQQELAFLFTLADAPVLGKCASSFVLTATLGARKRGVFAANVLVGERGRGGPLALVAATKEVYARVALDGDSEAWICAEEALQAGQLFFHGECQVSGHAEVELVDLEHARGQRFSFVTPKPGRGIAVISAGGVSVCVVLVGQDALDTLVVGYGPHSCGHTSGDSDNGGQPPAATVAAWGADGLTADARGSIGILSAGACKGGRVVAIAQGQPRAESGALMPMDELDADVRSAYGEHRFVWPFGVGAGVNAGEDEDGGDSAAVSGLERRTTSWGDLPWKLLPTMADLETMDQINVMSWQRDLGTFAYQASDIGYNGSHVLYRCQLRLRPQHVTSRKIELQLNVRHRCTVWVNGVNMSGHQTLHERAATPGSIAACIEALKNPGAAAGSDRWGGTATYDVTRAMQLSSADADEGALNEVHVLVESCGVGAQADGDNDARTPRGLISAYWHGFNFVGEDHDDTEIHDHEHDRRTQQMRAKWEICGVNVDALSDPYNTSGLPDEAAQAGWTAAVEHPLLGPGWSTRLELSADAGVQWWRWRLPACGGRADSPVHLRIAGEATAHVWVNGALVGKHSPGGGASRVLLRGGLAGQEASAAGDEVKIMLHGWADDSAASAGASGRAIIPVELSLAGGGADAAQTGS
ncbi:hypothetical protein LPJ61_000434 [Coemansia biformis]|uniref:Glycoside hydrolase 35 catalytic domain-containing protein n=1 Tax=Coemansia biformis TaxID=1286918 RepID=A0A9W7YBQ9_9FUNG|nr:hypothetical protein LPJ61_000434 [Coemansia biformis]